jgi:hypothetical protein
MKFIKEEAIRQLKLLTEEQCRAKMFLNENGFDCTTAPAVIVKRYRDDIKKYCEILRMNAYDD